MSRPTTQLQERLIGLLAEQLAVDPEELLPEQTFRQLGVDSLALVELVVAVENDLNLEFPAELDGIGRDSTLAEACRALERLAAPSRRSAGAATEAVGGEARGDG